MVCAHTGCAWCFMEKTWVTWGTTSQHSHSSVCTNCCTCCCNCCIQGMLLVLRPLLLLLLMLLMLLLGLLVAQASSIWHRPYQLVRYRSMDPPLLLLLCCICADVVAPSAAELLAAKLPCTKHSSSRSLDAPPYGSQCSCWVCTP